MKYLIAGRLHPGLGPYMDNWPKLAMLLFFVAAIAGAVALWNRSRYHP